MKIMITGGAGFIGSHLCDKLLYLNHELVLLTRNANKKHNISHILNKIKVEQTDITDFHKVERILEKYRPDVIIHLAGETSHSKSFENPLYDVDVNAKATLFMLEKIRKKDLTCKFVLGSTFIVIGKPTKLPVTEDSPCNPTTIYGVNRLSSEYFCKLYHHVYGLNTTIFRITNSFGPREQIVQSKNAINYLIYRAFKGKDITIFNNGKFFRDLIYISDVISGIDIILKKSKAGNLYWISSNKKTWFYQLGSWLGELTGAKVKYVKSSVYTKKVDVGNFVADNSKLKSLGWNTLTSVKDGIKRTLDNFAQIK